ncbi:ABC transporter permease subunit [Nocardioides marmoriginsengisoli]|uniref:branched-chain amino acid ABC transporter permease n=1 Tax=Nocardioides marmoriginsengisoli TaxID=661483 RepID=UPI0011CE06E3|nr:ABC transporter permease [Nocardioides marmoriginsengisoli]
MSDYLPFIVFGLVSGSVYGLSAMGLVLTYKTSGILNFGQGGVTAIAAFLYYDLTRNSVPVPIAIILVVLVFGTLSGLVLEVVARLLARTSTANRVVGTVGLLLFCQSILVVRYGGAALPFPGFLPQGGFTVSGTLIRADQVITAAIALAAAVGIFLFFRWTRLGTEMRAVVDDPDLLDMTGRSPVKVRRTAWIIGSVFASASGLLIAPTSNLDSVLLTLLVVQAFGAAAIGRFTSLPLAYAGGLVLGLLTSLAPKWAPQTTLFQGLPLAIPFLLLVVVLLVTSKSKLKEIGRSVLSAAPATSRLTLNQMLGTGIVSVVALALVPVLVGAKLIIWSQGLTYVILFLSLSLLVRLSGQVSLCHIAFQAVGAAVMTHLGDVPWLAAVLIAGLAAVPLGILVALPAVRLAGLFLAVTTLGLGILMQYLGYATNPLFGTQLGRAASRPGAFGLDGDKGYYYVLLAFVVGTAVLVLSVERSRMGRLLRGLADSPTALVTMGAGINGLRVLVFCLSAFVASVSGALLAPLFGVIDATRFGWLNSLVVLTVLVIAGRGIIVAPFIAAALIQVVPGYVYNQTFQLYLPVFFGLGALLMAVAPGISGSALVPKRPRRRAGDRAPHALPPRAHHPKLVEVP